MRYLKRQTTNRAAIEGKGVIYDINGQVVLDSTDMMLVPKGTTADATTSYTEGHIRYNTTSNEFECYQNGALRKMRFKEPTTITQQTVGYGDAVETIFGPLASGDSDYPNPAAAQNIIVLVENVFQLATTNYTIVQNPGNRIEIDSIISVGTTTVIQTATNHGLSQGDLVYVSQVESSTDDNLELLNTDDSSSPGSHNIESVPAANRLELGVDTSGANIANYVAGTGFILKAGSSTGPYLDGYYLQFTSAPDLGKPITVLHNFDK